MGLSTIATVDLMARFYLPLRVEGVSDGALVMLLGLIMYMKRRRKLTARFLR